MVSHWTKITKKCLIWIFHAKIPILYKKFNFRKNFNSYEFYSIFIQFDEGFWKENAQKTLRFFPGKISFFQFSFLFAGNFKYLILFILQYSRICSNFGVKFQICLKNIFFSKLNFLNKNLIFRKVCKMRLFKWFSNTAHTSATTKTGARRLTISDRDIDNE